MPGRQFSELVALEVACQFDDRIDNLRAKHKEKLAASVSRKLITDFLANFPRSVPKTRETIQAKLQKIGFEIVVNRTHYTTILSDNEWVELVAAVTVTALDQLCPDS